MLTLKRFVTILALVYLLVALLILLFPPVRTSTLSIFSAYSLPMEVNLLLGFTWASVTVVGLLLVFENLDSGLLRRKVGKQDAQINELKAQLYEAQKLPIASAPASPKFPAAGSSTYLPPTAY